MNLFWKVLTAAAVTTALTTTPNSAAAQDTRKWNPPKGKDRCVAATVEAAEARADDATRGTNESRLAELREKAASGPLTKDEQRQLETRAALELFFAAKQITEDERDNTLVRVDFCGNPRLRDELYEAVRDNDYVKFQAVTARIALSIQQQLDQFGLMP